MSRSRVPVRRASAIASARVLESAGAEIRPRERVGGEDVATFGDGGFCQSNGLVGTACAIGQESRERARARACPSATPPRPDGSCRSASSGRPSVVRRSPASAKSPATGDSPSRFWTIASASASRRPTPRRRAPGRRPPSGDRERRASACAYSRDASASRPASRHTDVPSCARCQATRFHVVRAGRVERHLHDVEGSWQVALQLARVRRACVGRRSRLQLVHAIERRERLVVVAELEVRVADDAVRRTASVGARPDNASPSRSASRNRWSERYVAASSPARFVVFGIASERGRQHALGFHRSSAMTGRARLTQQDVAERDGRG